VRGSETGHATWLPNALGVRAEAPHTALQPQDPARSPRDADTQHFPSLPCRGSKGGEGAFQSSENTRGLQRLTKWRLQRRSRRARCFHCKHSLELEEIKKNVLKMAKNTEEWEPDLLRRDSIMLMAN